MNTREFVYETYIRAPRETVWKALTNAEFTSQYFHATYVESTWKTGAPVLFRYAPGGDVAVDGHVIEATAPSRLVISWHVLYDEKGKTEVPSRVTFSLDKMNGQTRLRVSHDQFPEDSVLFEGISNGWPWILSGLKSLLETGKPLPLPQQSA